MGPNNFYVTKRDGNSVPLDVRKIKQVIAWATAGIDVNSIELESQANIKLYDGISTDEIQKTLIDTALSLTNLENDFKNLNWRFVASRLLLLNLYKGAKRTRGYEAFGYGSYYVFVNKATKAGLYDTRIMDNYSKEELKEMGKERDMKYDYEYDFSTMNIMANRYLIRNNGKIFELPQDMYLSIALMLALPEKPEDRIRVAKEFYHTMASQKLSPATPVILNCRKRGGNLTSCFITAMDDSLDNIYYTLDQIGQIAKNGGGSGVNISRVRSKGAQIRHVKGASGGVLPWVKLINDTIVAVNQLGSRAGVSTVAIDVWHKDIEDFLDMQTENGDQRRKSFDVFPQIVVTDEFLSRVENNVDWTLVDPYEVKKVYGVELCELYGEEFSKFYAKLESDKKLESMKTISARVLFKEFLKVVIETGKPYVFFKDTANRVNPNKHSGMIGNGNLCMESFTNFSPSKVGEKYLNQETQRVEADIDCGYAHTCNLASLNWAKFDTQEDIEEAVRSAVRMLDNTIEVTVPPIPEAKKHNQEYRILGIGSLGFADYLAKAGIAYQNAADEADKMFENVAQIAVDESANLAKIRGKYDLYEGSDWSKSIYFGHDMKELKETSSNYDRWVEIDKKVKENGMRNGGLFAIAPNTSTSLLMGATASVLPVYRKFFVDKSSKGSIPVVPPHLNEKTFWTYIENKHLDQNDLIKVCSSIQKWIDQGISMELLLNLNHDIKAKDIYDMYMNAWKSGCKTVYYLRTMTKTLESKKDECISCAN